MMDIQDVIDSIRTVTKQNYVLHKSIGIPSIKVYKRFVYVLYLINGPST